MREIAGTDKQGINAYGVVKADEQLGFTATNARCDVDFGRAHTK